MKLEVGMYVRTKEGYIDEVIIEYKGHCNNLNCFGKHVSCKYNYYDEDMVVKVSHNIIDLIEVGDYVNGLKITLINEPSMANCYKRIVYAEDEKDYLIKSFNENEIKSIVTKEQFESMSYKVGEFNDN